MLLGLLLIGIFPTSSMTITWTGLAHGKTSAAVKMTILGFDRWMYGNAILH